MADGKIYITISDTRGGSGAGVSNDADTGGSDKKQTITDFAKHKFLHLVDNEAKTFVNYSIGNIGNFTGNYQAQRDAQTAMSMMSEMINIGSSAVTAFASFGGGMQGGIAAAITVAATVTTKAINFGLQEYAEQFNNRRINRNIDYMRNRLGLEGLTNGSRSGGY